MSKDAQSPASRQLPDPSLNSAGEDSGGIGNYRHRSRASSRSSTRSESRGATGFAMPMSASGAGMGGGGVDPERLTPSVDLDDDRMSVTSSASKSKRTATQQHYELGFEKECSYESSPSSHMENKLDLAMVPVISDQLLYDIVNKERSIEQIDVHLFVKKALDLLTAKNTAELKIDHLKAKLSELEVENRSIRESKVKMQVRVEQEEEYISNMLLKRIQKLKTDKELLALKYEQEEEFLTNDLMRKLMQLEGERDELAARLSNEQSWVVSNLLQKIRKLEAEIQSNHKSLDQLRRDKVDLENALEHEQEALFNTLGKRMDALEAEKRRLQTKLDETDASRASLAGGESDPNVTKSGLTASTTAASIDAPSSTSSGVDLAEPSPLVSRSSINIGGVRDRPSTSMTSLDTSVSSQASTSGIGTSSGTRTNSTTE